VIASHLSPETKLGLKVTAAHLQQEYKGAKGVKEALSSPKNQDKIVNDATVGRLIGSVRGGISGTVQGVKSGLVLARSQGDTGKAKFNTVKRVVRESVKVGAAAGAAKGTAEAAARSALRVAKSGYKSEINK